jgi:hypothetical protein
VQGSEDEVAGLGHGERDLDRLDVAHLTDEQDVGVLSEGGAQRPVERGAVEADLALAHGGLLGVVDVLDGVLDREDVHGARLVDAVDDRRERRRLA